MLIVSIFEETIKQNDMENIEKLQHDKLRLELQLKSLLEVVSDELKKHRLESEKQDSLNLLRELHNERMAE